MPKKPSPRPARAPAGRKAAPLAQRSAKTVAPENSAPETPTLENAAPEPPVSDIAPPEKRPRAKVTIEPAQNLVVDEHDSAAVESIARSAAKSIAATRVRVKRSAVDRIGDPPPLSGSESSLAVRVSHAIERELSKIETIIGGTRTLAPVKRTETESRARVLASLARTLKEVMRLREQERASSRETMKAADDDVSRNLDELRSGLARRLAILVGEATALHPDAAE